MQQDNNIENKLRKMEAIEPPELGQMDAHWQQMAGMLQPPAVPLKKGWPKWMLNSFSALVVVVLIGAAMWFVSTKNADESKRYKVAVTDTAIVENASVNALETVQELSAEDTARTSAVSIVSHTASLNASLIKDDIINSEPVQWTEQDSILGTLKLNVTDCLNCPAKTDSVAVISNTERQLRFNTLFTELEKAEQHFTIDNRRDTLLQFAEGTALLIPANSFGGMNEVEITAKEFYKTSDIVLNQLSTASNKEQLETGGMLRLTASHKGTELKINSRKPVTLFLPDTSNEIKSMQLFIGEDMMDNGTLPNSINWNARPQYFTKRRIVTEVRILNLADIPWLIKEDDKKKVGFFIYDEDGLAVSKREMKRLLKEKYGYTKVKLTSSIRNRFLPTFGKWAGTKFDRRYSESVGDSVWMEKAEAERYGLNTNNATIRQSVVEELSSRYDSSSFVITRKSRLVTENLLDYVATNSVWDVPAKDSAKISVIADLRWKYSINLSELGWINCDRFYSDSRKKVNFKVDLGDAATNYYTLLVFDKIKSMMTGAIDGNQVAFQNIPVGEPVKVISIGINKQGETVYSVTHTTTSDQELKGLQFQTTSVPDLKASLSKLDK